MTETFTARMNGYFKGILQWPELDVLWERLRANPEGWYASLAGDIAPTEPLDPSALLHLLRELDTLLRREHDYNYCGIVYVDDAEQPSLIKIYDPNNLGSSCGCGGARIPPRWVLSRMPHLYRGRGADARRTQTLVATAVRLRGKNPPHCLSTKILSTIKNVH